MDTWLTNSIILLGTPQLTPSPNLIKRRVPSLIKIQQPMRARSCSKNKNSSLGPCRRVPNLGILSDLRINCVFSSTNIQDLGVYRITPEAERGVGRHKNNIPN